MLDLNLVKELGGVVLGDLDVSQIKDIHNMYQEITPNSIFIAVKGVNFDGAVFIEKAIKKGAIAVIVGKKIENLSISQIIVDDPVFFVIRYAIENRKKFKNKVIGIVGSVGKTTTRHVLSSLLPGKKIYTRKSFNVKFTIAMSLILLDNSYDYAIIEMGTNILGEVDDISRVVNPDYTIINTVGIEHAEFLGDLKSILKEEYSVIKNTKIACISDFKNRILLEEFELLPEIEKSISHYFIPEYVIDKKNVSFEINSHKYKFKSPSRDRGFINAIVLSIFLSNLLNLDILEIIKNAENLHPICHRNSVIHIDNLTIHDCCFNANPVSVKNTLESIDQKCTLIIGQMNELGIISKKEHEKILKEIFDNEFIEKCFTIGSFEIPKIFEKKIKIYDESVLDNLSGVLYIQGSRGLKLEMIVFKLLNKKFENMILKKNISENSC